MSLLSFRFVTIYIWNGEKMQMNKIQICHNILWICENLHINTSKFKEEFGCLPSTHVEGSLKGWPNNHVRGCIFEELLSSN